MKHRVRKQYVLEQLAPYWGRGREAVAALPVTDAPPAPVELPPRLCTVALPEWAADWGVDGKMAVPVHAVTASSAAWDAVDWWETLFWFLNALPEREHERRHGPIHSYRLRLNGWPSLMWDYAWVNRIALFLRRWAARTAGQDEEVCMGPLPKPRIHLTHDVDALEKTLPLRLKRGVFLLLNAGRALAGGAFAEAGHHVTDAFRFMFRRTDYRCTVALMDLERSYGATSQFNVYGGGCPRPCSRRYIFDPGYDVLQPDNASVVRAISSAGFAVGLHPSFESWHDAEKLRAERERLEAALGTRVTRARQHWLRFAWQSTWDAQEAAGLMEDGTLGFNDHPGFRCAAALRFKPWSEQREEPHAITELPFVLMDAHLYDYHPCTSSERRQTIRRWLGEVLTVRGEAAIIWHQRTIHPDYGWDDGLREILEFARQNDALGTTT